MQTSLCHLKIVFTVFKYVLDRLLQYQDVMNSKPGFALAEGKWSNLIRIHSLQLYWKKTPW